MPSIPKATDLLGFNSGTIRGLGALFSTVYVAVFFGYNIYAQFAGHPFVTDMPYMEAAVGYMLYYLGLRTDLPTIPGQNSSIISKVFVRPSTPSATEIPAPPVPAENSGLETVPGEVPSDSQLTPEANIDANLSNS